MFSLKKMYIFFTSSCFHHKIFFHQKIIISPKNMLSPKIYVFTNNMFSPKKCNRLKTGFYQKHVFTKNMFSPKNTISPTNDFHQKNIFYQKTLFAQIFLVLMVLNGTKLVQICLNGSKKINKETK